MDGEDVSSVITRRSGGVLLHGAHRMECYGGMTSSVGCTSELLTTS